MINIEEGTRSKWALYLYIHKEIRTILLHFLVHFRELKDIQAIGTDGDEALMNAVTICFQDAQKLLCADHKKAILKEN